jgi:hypothetical protein
MSSIAGCLGLVFSFGSMIPHEHGPDLSNRDVQAGLAQAVRKALPQGWAVTGTTPAATPPDWHTDSLKAGFAVSGRNGPQTFTIYFLPADWIGIRKVPNAAPRHTYWEGILVGDGLVTITASSDLWFHEGFQRNSPWRSTPSLTNGGFWRTQQVFFGRRKAIDATALALVHQHCRTPAEFAEAAHSLVVLGVPAKSVFLRAAREVEGMGKDLFCSALGRIGGADAVDAICDVLADPRVPDHQRMYAAMALGHQAVGPGVLPALRAAARQMKSWEPMTKVLAALTVRGDARAAPDLLVAFGRAEDDMIKAEIAHALAGLRCREALPVVRRFADDLKRRAVTDKKIRWLARWGDLAVLRFTGDGGGVPGPNARYFLLPPDELKVGEAMTLRIVAENISNQWQHDEHDPELGLVVDGRQVKVPNPPPPGGGPVLVLGGGLMVPPQLGPGMVKTVTYDLSRVIKTPGRHTVQYSTPAAKSAVITIFVTASEQ